MMPAGIHSKKLTIGHARAIAKEIGVRSCIVLVFDERGTMGAASFGQTITLI